MPVAISCMRKERYVFYCMGLPRSLRSLAMTVGVGGSLAMTVQIKTTAERNGKSQAKT